MPEVFNATHTNTKSHKKHHANTPNVTRHRHLSPELKAQLKGHSKNPLASFCYFPQHANFIGADKDEKIVLILRRHPITNVPWVVIALIMIFLPLLFAFFAPAIVLPVNFLIVIALFWYLIILAFILEEFLSWFFNVYIITDERVFDVDFHNLVYREITDANLDQIQDVTVTVGSVVRTVFDYGDITIQTAAQIPQLEFEAVPNPDQVALVLRELRVEEEIEKIEGRVR